MEAAGSRVAPHRTRGAACLPCRQRKSRCTVEPSATVCLMCRAHQTQCQFAAPRHLATTTATTPTAASPRRARDATARRPRASPKPEMTTATHHHMTVPTPGIKIGGDGGVSSAPGKLLDEPDLFDEAQDESPHVLGPAVAQDSHVLEDYLLSIDATPGVRRVRPVIPGSVAAPVLFARVQKRPLGTSDGLNYALSRVQMIEKLLEPWQPDVIDLYFQKANASFPIINETSFRHKYATAKQHISPAMLACIYANSLVYWKSDPTLVARRNHDDRFIWNLALEALYSELHLYPGSSTIVAILLDILGRPTTTVIGNGALLGAATSLANGLGLNRDPSSWDIPDAEKSFRINLWWCIVIYDRWASFSYGTPPHIRATHHDVPLPGRGDLSKTDNNPCAAIFAALARLSDVLDLCLDHIYQVKQPLAVADNAQPLNRALSEWIDSLSGDVRRVILRGTCLNLRGAANLRLAYLAVHFLICKIELSVRSISDPSLKLHDQTYVATRRAAEEITIFVQELGKEQLSDFWLPTASFIFSSTATFLIRSAVDTEIPRNGSDGSTSLSLARDLISSLRRHHQESGWDIGELCVNQYADIVERLTTMSPPSDGQLPASTPFLLDMASMDNIMPDFMDSFFLGQFD